MTFCQGGSTIRRARRSLRRSAPALDATRSRRGPLSRAGGGWAARSCRCP
jgi:hypothetical protein